jgi:hypothetical protein
MIPAHLGALTAISTWRSCAATRSCNASRLLHCDIWPGNRALARGPFPGVCGPEGGDALHGDFRVASQLDWGTADMPTLMLWIQSGWKE